MNDPEDLFWDTCIITRSLTRKPTDFVQDIGAYLDDARKGRRRIHLSTIVLAELQPSALKEAGFGSLYEFLDDFGMSSSTTSDQRSSSPTLTPTS